MKGPKPKPLSRRLLGLTLFRPKTTCWIFSGWRLPNGYGHIGSRTRGKTLLAHRAAWMAFNGAIPQGMQVLHRCDVRGCVNPDHLFLGTPKDNMADMISKGRAAKGNHIGSKNSQSKLTDDLVKTLRSDPRPAAQLAREWGIAPITAQQARSGHTWKHVK